MKQKLRFISSYLGKTDYLFQGVRYRKRFVASTYERSIYAPGVFDRECLPAVGTIMGKPGEFPSPDIMRHFPGYVAARWNPDTNQIETQGEPAVIDHPDFAPWAERVSRAHADEIQTLVNG